MGIPKKLYKYESFTTQSLSNLKSQILYFGSPLDFNDPYDCAITARIKEPTDTDVESFRVQYSKIPDFPEQTKQALAQASTDELRSWLHGVGNRSISDIVHKAIDGKGISCFSEKHNDLLMWSHYGDKNKGFCLEFDTSFEPFNKAKKVKYTEEIPSISITDAIVKNNFEQLFDLYCTKSTSWEYEAEWRCIHHHVGTKWIYESEALTGVYFGSNVPDQVIDIVCLILQGQNTHVKYWKGKRSDTKFELEFEDFNYIPYIVAKDRGLVT